MSFGIYDPTKKGKTKTKTKRFYLEYGSNIYRVLPPVKSLKESGEIAQYWSVIWITDTKGKKRPVASILRKNKDTIIQRDPLIEKIESMKKEYDEAVASGASPEVLASLKEKSDRLYNKKVYALNVLTPAGEVGVLEIPYTSYQSLEQRITELRNKGIDAISIGEDCGVFFDFKKLKDERGRITYPVDIATKTTKDPNGNFIVTYIRAPITEEEAEKISQQAEDLTKLYRELSFDEMAALATFDQRVFDAIFSKGQPVKNDTNNEQSDLGNSNDDEIPEVTYAKQKSVNSETPIETVGVMTASGSTKSPVLDDKFKKFIFPDKN